MRDGKNGVGNSGGIYRRRSWHGDWATRREPRERKKGKKERVILFGPHGSPLLCHLNVLFNLQYDPNLS